MNDNNKNDLKKFFIKLVAATLAIIIVINVSYNLIFADKFENINKILSLNEQKNIEEIKDKIRNEISKGLEKENMINDEDKKLILKLYKKLKKEFKDFETN